MGKLKFSIPSNSLGLISFVGLEARLMAGEGMMVADLALVLYAILLDQELPWWTGDEGNAYKHDDDDDDDLPRVVKDRRDEEATRSEYFAGFQPSSSSFASRLGF